MINLRVEDEEKEKTKSVEVQFSPPIHLQESMAAVVKDLLKGHCKGGFVGFFWVLRMKGQPWEEMDGTNGKKENIAGGAHQGQSDWSIIIGATDL
ncbi:hypothetical protein PPACK8108_LOCUS1447 [Phakopsora pachyrhizi]|uniref:Uncharacterized protein n=1 Tax=Phakopsora pachyrhizi TaxID=170000 RepID=A0AAV0AHQ7_PHAPC|nr:hypothetical protein PPACK8108_LOCUS1447 [Phakopsora pachyrhizi]